jgi:phosphoglycolate phosphatase-like HAD superfamily hydrolase
MKEYRIIVHGLDDTLNDEINSMAQKGWEMFRAFEPQPYSKHETWGVPPSGEFIRIIWQRDGFFKYMKK